MNAVPESGAATVFEFAIAVEPPSSESLTSVTLIFPVVDVENVIEVVATAILPLVSAATVNSPIFCTPYERIPDDDEGPETVGFEAYNIIVFEDTGE